MLTWNPRQGRPPDLGYAVGHIVRGKPCRWEWSTGSRKDLPVGSRVFLVRQGVEPRGIVACGFTLTAPKQNDESHDHSQYCKIAWTMALDAEGGEVLSLGAIGENKFLAEVPWGIAGGGREFRYEEATEVERLWSELLSGLNKTELVSK
jgi:hypothetical protein